MVAPPSFAGAVKETVAWVFPPVADTPVGGPGTVLDVAELEGEDADEVPTAFLATTVKVYVTPLVRPVTTRGEEDPVAVNPPGLEVTV